MANVAVLLKQEIQRLAKRESKLLTEPLKKTVMTQRRQLAGMRKQVSDLSREVASLRKALASMASARPSPEEPAGARAPSARAIQSLRARLALSAGQLATLVGVSDQSIYNWERGRARPTGSALQSLRDLRGLGKREVRRQLEQQAR